jgi:ferredoxin
MTRVFSQAASSADKITIELRKKSGEIFKTISARRGVNLWVLLRRYGVPVGASCSGVGVCGKCAVRAVSPQAGSITGKTEFESQTIQRQGLADDLRLTCLCRAQGDLVLTADYW